MDKVIEFAKEQGYDNASYLGEWDGYKVYEPTFDGDDVLFIGVPLVILVKNEVIKMSTVEEAFQVMDELEN